MPQVLEEFHVSKGLEKLIQQVFNHFDVNGDGTIGEGGYCSSVP